LCRSLSSDTLSTGRRSAGRGPGVAACRPPGSSWTRGSGRRARPASGSASGALVAQPLRKPAALARGQGASGRRGSAKGEGKGLRGRASSCFSRWRLWMTRMASGVRLKEKRMASSGSASAPAEVPAKVAPAGLWPGPARRGVAHVAGTPARPGEAWCGARAGAGGCVLPGTGLGSGPRRAGGLFRVAEGQELESGTSGLSGGLFFFSPAAAGGEGAGGAQDLRGSWRAAGTPGARAGGGGGGGIGGKGVMPPSGRIVSPLEGEGRVLVPAPAPSVAERTRAPSTPTCGPSPHLPLLTAGAPAKAPPPLRSRAAGLPRTACPGRTLRAPPPPPDRARVPAPPGPQHRDARGWARGRRSRARSRRSRLPSPGLRLPRWCRDRLLNAGDKVPEGGGGGELACGAPALPRVSSTGRR
jgi:hypothetical protein